MKSVHSALLFLLFIPGGLLAQVVASSDAPRPPTLKVGLFGGLGLHREFGDAIQKYFGETAGNIMEIHPRVNAGATAGIAVQFSGRHFGLELTSGAALQHYHWDFDGVYWRRPGTGASYRQKVGEHLFFADFDLAAFWKSEGPRPFRIAVGGFAGYAFARRSRSYIQLPQGNFIQPQSFAVPAGISLKLSKAWSTKGWQLEPYLELRQGLNSSLFAPTVFASMAQLGLIAWIPVQED